jgi:hypothetical protein
LYKAIEVLFNYSFLKLIIRLQVAPRWCRQAPLRSPTILTFYSETQVHVEGGANEAL